jgi:hypothetical protein
MKLMKATFVFVAAGWVLGCGNGSQSSTGSGGSGGSGGQTTSSSGGSGGSGGQGGSGGSGGQSTGSGGAAVDDCQAQAEAVKVACMGQADRTCLFDHYKTLFCPTERADVLAAGLACLKQFSQDSCRTFSDPSGAGDCVKTAFAKFDLTKAKELATVIQGKCNSATVDQILNAAEPPIAVLTDADIEKAKTCVTGAADCQAATDCFKTQFPDFFNCPM